MIAVIYKGTDGSLWNLNSGPVRLTDKGIQGLGNPELLFYKRETAFLDGQVVTGWKAKPRKVFLPLLLGSGTTELEWLALERAWWAANGIGLYGSLLVTAPDGQTRTLDIRFEDDGGGVLDVDPSWEALSVVGNNYTADEPWWYGPEFGQAFQVGSTTENFFGGDASPSGGPPFIIGASNTLGAASFTNPGDLDAWPIYVITGPSTGFSSTLAGGTVGGSIVVPAGATLTVDTNPTKMSALLKVGAVITNVTPQLTDVGFRKIPAGGTSAISLIMNGLGMLNVYLSPKYKRAW